jgi:hypothetical protein
VKNYFGYCDFPRFEVKSREAKVLLKPSRIKSKYLEVLKKKYETWSEILPLHAVLFKIISR